MLIAGENIDCDSRNGAGKTSILNAISYALYNKPIAQISKERLINRTNASKTTSMEVRLEFAVGGKTYEISRSRGESYSIVLTEDGRDITPDSIASTDRKIVELIGISYELFCISIVFSGPDQPFLSLPIAAQRNVIEELFKITALSEKAVKLKEKIAGIQTEIKIQDALLVVQQGAVDNQVKRISDAENRLVRWESDNKSSIEQLTQKISAVKLTNFEEQQHLFDQLQAETKQNDSNTANRTKLANDNKRIAKRIKELSDQIKHLQDDKCPYCLQGFAGAGNKLSELVEELSVKEAESIELDAEIEMLNSLISKSLDASSNFKSALKYTSMVELVKDQNSILILEDKLTDLSNSENPHTEAYEKLLLEDIKEPDFDVIDDLKTDLEHHQFMLKLLTDKNSFVRKRIINKTIPFLNTQINEYTTKLGLPHKVKFDPDMSCTVSEYNRALDFGNLSSGEKKRVNLALSLAFRDVLHRLHSKVNLLLMDEMDAGLDSAGVDAAFNLIKQKAKADGIGIWIISHRPEAEVAFEKTITVRKEGGFSTITL